MMKINEETRDQHKLTTLALLLRWVMPRLLELVGNADRETTALMNLLPESNPAYRHVVVLQREVAQLQQSVQYLLSRIGPADGTSEDLLSCGQASAREIIFLHEALSYAHHQMLMAQGKLSASDPLFTDLIHIYGTMKRMAKLVTGLLVYYESPTQTGPYAGGQSLLDLTDVVKGTLDMLVASLPPQIVLKSDLPLSLPLVAGDSGAYRQMVTELLVNAVEAVESQGGTVYVSTDVITVGQDTGANGVRGDRVQPGEYVCLAVADDGPGMAPTILEKVFADQISTKGRARGRGLMVVRGIAHANGGGATVKSEPAQGTTLEVFLPLGKEKSKAVSHRTQRPGKWPVPTVHVADGDHELRKIVLDILARAGFEVDGDGEKSDILLSLPGPQVDPAEGKAV